ncbi:MAG TPA: BadF/BadG/BcrA/BcrD ATPase family protein [Thermotogota bacterium]|nr:BadF/BadG/BcrA/BcrD ATPase family protein [Thermotogota bacterium]HPJ89473.1 BadF/BadG/BcrA/BcrD ATPase family protein [Thermotogota bacterium]HPR96339.1 BadF/BadG/BcrA/BcrD ATPase family protein [Thermotogota bacterium]
MYFLGVDIGGTKTAVVVSDENGNILSYKKGPGANYQGCGIEEAYERTNDTIEQVCYELGIGKEDLDNAFLGIAGVDLEYDIQIIKGILERINLPAYGFENDGLIAFRSGTVDGRGILVTCGTGSISFGSDGNMLSRKGGFSTYFGERLGGSHVARLAASAIIRAKDGRGQKTLMSGILEDEFGADIEEMMKIQYPDVEYQGPNPTITLIKTIYRAAERNDLVAVKLLAEIADEVINIVRAYRVDMNFTPPVKVVLEGTVFKKAEDILMEYIRTGLGSEYRIIVPTHDPVTGALLYALERHGIELTEQIIETIFTTFEEMKAITEREGK